MPFVQSVCDCTIEVFPIGKLAVLDASGGYSGVFCPNEPVSVRIIAEDYRQIEVDVARGRTIDERLQIAARS